MKTKLTNHLELLRTSFWFIPVLLLLGASTTAVAMVALDRSFDHLAIDLPWFLYNVNAEGARTILSTIAGSMMTVAGVTFSITIVTLNLASSQFGPRLLRNFMQDRKTQFALGTFVSTFIYCLLILHSTQPIGNDIFVPKLAVTFSVLLAMFNVGVLISFIHHIAISIQADIVVATIGKELERNVMRIFPDKWDDANPGLSDKMSALQEEVREHLPQQEITAHCSGYLQAIDFDGLMDLAVERDYIIHIELRPGLFVVENSVMAKVTIEEELDEVSRVSITRAFIIGDQRTPEQDIEYSIHQLVEVAVRALSPGVNDPNTAISCIDQLGVALCFLAERHFPPPNCFDNMGMLRLRIKPFTFRRIVRASFDQIRQNGIDCPAVVIRILEILDTVSKQSRHSEQRAALYHQANMVIRGLEQVFVEEDDQRDICSRYQKLLETLDCFEDEGVLYKAVAGESEK